MPNERFQRRIERLLDEADEAISQFNWERVRQCALAVLAIDPENADGLTFLATVDRALGESFNTTPSNEPAITTQSTPHAAIPDQPTSFADGRYQVKRFLGEGGKKRVYLAQDTLLDREVAFALIKTEGLDETSRTRIQREAQAMGRLGSHPHIVTVFDLGQEQDQPYMVTELMGGGDVEGVIEHAKEHRIPLKQAISIAVETCRGLEFAHSRGIVHRDLKPGNVWMTSDGVAKIGDFGLAVALDRSRLTTEGMMVGTVSYMPPEQAMGGDVTPKSDLYSLGAMLYEMVTGRPPFLGDDSVAIIGQHINTPPVSPTWHNAQCPRPLEALIMRLLAKDPSERPELASDVLSALDGIDLATSIEQPIAEVDEAHALDSLAGGVFVGRQREMGELKGCLEDALSGRGRLVTLVGEPGIGKTRTAQELATYAGLRGAQVLWGRCYEEQGAPPYWPWVQAIRSYVRDIDPEQLRSDMGAGAADIAEVVSDVRGQLPGLDAPPQLEPEQARFRLFDSITAFLKSAARRKPMVLVLDDLHWADHPSLLLLEFVARELANARVMVIGTYRDMELSRQHPLSQTLGELTRERLFQRVLLRGLDQQDVGRFIKLASGVTPPAGMLEAVHQQTEGNPLFVTEVVRLLVQEGELTQEKTGHRDSWSVRIPEGVREVIGRRLDRLSERCNETLTVASVLGREFTLEQLSPLIEDISADRLLEVLEEALASRVLEELPHAVGRYQFTHALIQETLTEELTLTRKVRLHARIAETLERLYGNNLEAHAAELAYHFAAAETITGTDRLVRYSGMAGERAMAAYAYEEASGHFERALAAKEGAAQAPDTKQETDEETAGLLYGLGRAQLVTLKVEQGWANLTRAFDYYAGVGDIPRVVDIADYPVTVSAPGNVAPLLTRALELVPPDSYEAGRLLPWHGRLLNTLQGDYQGAQDALSRSLAIAEREGDRSLKMQALAFTADMEGSNHHWDRCLEAALQAVDLTGDADNPLAECFAHMWAARSMLATGGDSARLRQHTADCLLAAERLHDHLWLPIALGGLNTLVYSSWGDWQAAREFSDRGLDLAPTSPLVLPARIMLECQLGHFDQGDTYLQRLVETLGEDRRAGRLNTLIPMMALIGGKSGGFDIAEARALATLSSLSGHHANLSTARIGLALIAVQRSDTAGAAEQFSALEPLQGTMTPGLSWAMSIDRLLGLLLNTMGRLDRATGYFEDAIAICRRAVYRPELAWTNCDYADTLLQRDEPGDRSRAMSLLDEALAISTELGMRPLMERVLSRREILKA